MIERLQQALMKIEKLPPEVQEEVAAEIEALTEPFEERLNMKTSRAGGKRSNLAGAWSDLAWDDEAEAFDRMHHATQPSPPLDYETYLLD